MENIFYAHSLEGRPTEDWQLLEDHLSNVGKIAGAFAAAFNAQDWGGCAGVLHDAGKASTDFQRRLRGSNQRVDHSSYGARLAKEKAGQLGLLLSYVIAGHHGGIPDGGEQPGQLHFRLRHGTVPEDIKLDTADSCKENLKFPFKLKRERGSFSLSFFTRMLFSCLVDADFLDTEKFCAPDIANERNLFKQDRKLHRLQQIMKSHMDELSRKAEPTYVNALRKRILGQCRQKAKLPPQVFSLTVPTGGGKTLSSMSFALEHAVAYNLDRIIYAIPFTSIIEQNAGVFQNIFGGEQVLEHHCNYRESDNPDDKEYYRRRGLAAENWDLPVIVTTNVQFFESLFGNKPSKCRKLHNIARSVIVLDEAQAIPTDYLEPCLAALRELIDHYSCSVVLCTATQPALDDKSNLRGAFPQVTEIIDDVSRTFSELQRTSLCFIGKKSDAELARLIKRERQALCIVATKPHAKEIFQLLAGETGVFHLSTNMYPHHRQRVLKAIKDRLKARKACRVVSTSLVEAGVDLDFPVVFRAMAGLDSIAQAAGRCNREGKMDAMGQVFVFESEKKPRMPWLNRCASIAAEAMRCMPEHNPLDLQAMRRYFELLYDIEDLDKKQIMRLLNPKRLDKDLLFPFKEAARTFQLIEEDTIGVVVAIDSEAQQLVSRLRYAEYPGTLLRKLQPYSVALRTNDFAMLQSAGALGMIDGEVPILRNRTAYSDDVGLLVSDGPVWQVDDLIV